MDITKKKYNRNEVLQFIEEKKSEYDGKLSEMREKNAALTEQNRLLCAELELFREKDALISETLKKAQEKALETERRIKEKYTLEVLALKDFRMKWKAYFDYLKETYPYYPATNRAKSVYEQLCAILSQNESPKIVIDEMFSAVENVNNIENGVSGENFNPKTKIEEYIAATDGGFNMEEVLNPGELHLEDLCKELGLMEEK